MERRRGLAVIVAAIVVVAVAVLVVDALVTPRPTRIALYGDSLSMQSAQDFQFLAVESSKTTTDSPRPCCGRPSASDPGRAPARSGRGRVQT